MAQFQPLLKPDWLKVRPPGGDAYLKVKGLLRDLKLNTVCEEARCPNVAECWGGGTATIMLLGDTCTRACRFCNVKTGNPKGVVDEGEPDRVARAIVELGLKYVVLTSVDRDDLADGGAEHFARTVETIKQMNPKILVEVLTPDFLGLKAAIDRICASGADVIAHNLETVRRLTPKLRDRRCDYDVSLRMLKAVKQNLKIGFSKSSLMVGVGETQEEVLAAMDDLRESGVDILTIGQYLRPSNWHLPVHEYLHPDVFSSYREEGTKRGFRFVAAGPLVRSSYRAGEHFVQNILKGKT